MGAAHNLARAAVIGILAGALAACGGGDECPAVTPDNVHQMTGDLPPGSPCTQDYAQPEN